MGKVRKRQYSLNPNAHRGGGTGKFAAKMTFEDRCGVFFASRVGVPDWALLAISGMGRSSVTRLLDEDSVSYRNVHEEYKNMGHEAFGEKYYTPEIRERFEALVAAQQVRRA